MTKQVIFQPPKPNPVFVPELHDLLTRLCSTSTNMVILGDMNIHVDASSGHPAFELLQLLDSINLRQHVDVTTHSAGHFNQVIFLDRLNSTVCLCDLALSWFQFYLAG